MGKSMQELVRLAAEGNQSAIGELYELTYSSVYKTVKLMVKDDDVALDIVQESYIKGFQSLNQLDTPEHFQAWMKTIASNKARDYFRKKKATLFSEMENEDGDIPDFEDNCIEHLPEEVLDRAETARLLKEIIDSLSEDQRAVIYMYHYKEMTVQEIAAALECSENTIKSRLRYARNKIKEKVEDLEKKGTKLYSLSPISFFTFLLRMAKMQGITFSLDGFGKAAAAGTATMVTEAAATAAESAAASSAAATGAAAAGETAAATAGSAATANAAAGAAAKAAGGAASKALATKIVAGTLAATMTVGAGAIAVSSLNSSKENEKAHVIYEEFLGRYRNAFEMDASSFRMDYDRFWSEISEDILEQHPEIDLNKTNSIYLNYIPGEDFEEGIPVPDTVYEPNMDSRKLLEMKIDGDRIRYSYDDADGDGQDELFIWDAYRDGPDVGRVDVYTVREGKLIRGKVNERYDGVSVTWELTWAQEAEYVDPGVVYINLGKEYFAESLVIGMPESECYDLCSW